MTPTRVLSIALAILFSFGCLCAQGNDLEARRDAVREFLNFFKKAKDEAVQREAVETLRNNECPEAAEQLLKLLKHPSAVVQQTALGVLATYTDPATYKTWIEQLPTLKDADLTAILIKVLGQAKQKEALPAILQVAGDAKANATVKFEAARALQCIGGQDGAELLGRFLADADPFVRMAAADAVGALNIRAFPAPLIALLKDGEWQVQTAAVTAVAATRPQDAIQPLIDLMRENGRLRAECADALFHVTGFDFGIETERWQQQYDALKAIAGWRIPTDEELKKRAESRQKYDALYGKVTEKPAAFVGIPTTSTNVLFIIDVSGSMDDLVVETEKFQGYRDRKRLTIVQTELANAIDSLSDNTNFDIVAFATDLQPWKKRLVPANIVNKDAAKSFVKRLKPIGGTESQEAAAAGLSGSANLEAGKTNTLKALLYPFGVDPDHPPPKATVTGFDKNSIKRPLDTVYFLSDGRPSVGKIIEPLEILKEVRHYNETYRIVIHAVAIGEFQKEFLKQLAEENGGVFVDLGR